MEKFNLQFTRKEQSHLYDTLFYILLFQIYGNKGSSLALK